MTTLVVVVIVVAALPALTLRSTLPDRCPLRRLERHGSLRFRRGWALNSTPWTSPQEQT